MRLVIDNEMWRIDELATYSIGQDNSKGSGIFFMLYKTFLICWISFGLGYTVMIMTFIARGMRSKKITRIEHKLAVNLKHTQSKIWNEFSKEISYLRRVFNELQLSKVKVSEHTALHLANRTTREEMYNTIAYPLLQRVYVDECTCEIPPSKYPRSNSFPDLRDLSYGSKEKDGVCCRPRRRANSEVVATVRESFPPFDDCEISLQSVNRPSNGILVVVR